MIIKKLTAIFLTVLTAMSLLSGGGTVPVRGAEESGQDHEHVYGPWSAFSEPTCKYDGVAIRTCTLCDAYEKKVIPARGHSLVPCDGKPATTDELGWEPYEKCLICGYSTCQPYLLGDLTGDMTIDMDDAVSLLYFIFFPDETVKQYMDYNEDGAVDEQDVIRLVYYLFFPEVYPIKEPEHRPKKP